MTTLLDVLKAKDPKLADAIEWTIADAISKRIAAARFRRELRPNNPRSSSSDRQAPIAIAYSRD